MTVETQTKKVTANGNDSATVFSFSPIVIYATTDLVVTKVSSAGVESTLVEGSSDSTYSVAAATSFPGTGSVTYPAVGGTPLATGDSIVMKRVLTLEQTLDLENQGGYLPENQETAFDKLLMIDLQQQDVIDRSVKVPISVSGFSGDLPGNIAGKAGEALVVNADGDGFSTSASAGDATINNFWTNVLDDNTLDASITSLGGAQAVQTSIFKKGADVASANTLTLGSDGNYFDITGTTSITSIATIGVGAIIRLHFDGALTFTHHATNLILPGGENITTFAGYELTLIEYGTGTWRAIGSGDSFLATGTGATVRAKSSKIRDIVSVKDFGAVGDGTTNDAVAIQAAIDATPAGGCLYFPAGTGSYYCGNTVAGRLYVLKEMMFKGDGWGSILEWDVTAWTDDQASEAARAALNVHLGAGVPSALMDYFICKDMAFDFGGSKSSTWAEGRRGIHAHTVDNFIMSNCKVQGGAGFSIMSTGDPPHSHNALIGCEITDSVGPVVNMSCDEFLMVGNRLYDGGGIEIGAPDNAVIVGNQFIDLLATAIQLACDNFIISGNVFDNILINSPGASVGGITVQAGGGNAPAPFGIMSNNSMITPSDSANRNGILLQRGTATSDHNNLQISNNSISGPHVGIQCSSLKDSSITGNMLRGRTGGVGVGIHVASNQTNSLRLHISGNDIKDYSAKTNVITTNGPIQFSTAVMTDHVVGWNTQENTLVIGAAGEGAISPTSVATDEIVFPATQVPSAGANTLDDYEEGTWTPVLTFTTPGDLSVGYTTQRGIYRKIGGAVIVNFEVRTSSFTHTTASGVCRVTGLPFTSLATYSYDGACAWGGITKASYTHVVAEVAPSTTVVQFRICGSAQVLDQVASSSVPTGGTVRLNCNTTYMAA